MSTEPQVSPSAPGPGKTSIRSKRTSRPSRAKNFLEGSPLISILLLSLFGAALITICFFGLPIAGPNTYAYLKSPQRVLSSLTFSYESDIRTRTAREERSNRVHPVYVITTEPYKKLEDCWYELMGRLNDLEPEKHEERTDSEENPQQTELFSGISSEEFRLIAEEMSEKYEYSFRPADLETLFRQTDIEMRNQIGEQVLPIIASLFSKGIYSSSNGLGEDPEHSGIIRLSFLQTDDVLPSEQMDSLANAERNLYLEVTSDTLDYPSELKKLLNRILREGLAPNIQYDEVLTMARRKEAMDRVKPVIERIQQGDIVVDTGVNLGPLEMERLTAYRNELKRQQVGYSWLRFKQEIFLTFLILIAVYLFLRATNNQILRDNRKVASTVLLVLLQLGLTRLLIDLTDSSLISQHPITPHILPYLVPFSLAPILLGVLLGLGPGLFVSIFIGLFIALMFNGSPLILVISVFSSIVGLYFSQNIRKRSKLVKSGFMAGAATACCPIILGLALDTELTTIAIQVTVTLGVGFVVGTLLVGILPVMENIFRFTTDITLLELTDYNHPLLRELQLRAPGSYHHSLTLANLTENAAAAIGANPLLARVCSYYHDVGKMIKPEYFIENQRDGINPHLERNPSMSALVIKAHVKEGVALARQHKLPQVIIDVIQQHHGTTLIQYFFFMAKDRERQKTRDPFGINVPDLSEISESTYRYDGPRPRFKESAIVFLGDAVEAASRTLRKVSVQSIEELIDKLFDDRIRDGQLDESPLTFSDIRKIKKSFAFTLINALHARIEYPGKKEEVAVDKTKEKTRESTSQATVNLPPSAQ